MLAEQHNKIYNWDGVFVLMERGNMANLVQQKDKIISLLKVRGPSLPVHIAQHLHIDSLLASAILSEMLGEKILKLSNLKVGNSPLYYLPGQEFQIVNFYQYLPGKEKEAFELLQNKNVLKDLDQLPAIRVALRSMKDFSFPFMNNGNLYWRFVKIGEGNAHEIIKNNQNTYSEENQKIENVVKERQLIDEPSVFSKLKQVFIPPQENKTNSFEQRREGEIDNKINNSLDKEENLIVEKENEKSIEEKNIEIREESADKVDDEAEEVREGKNKNTFFQNPFDEIKKPKKKEKKKSEFEMNIKSLLEEMEVKQDFGYKKKEYGAVVSHQGKDFLLVGKDKKAVNYSDLTNVLEKGKKLNLPVMLVSKGEPNKKAAEWIDYFGELIVFKKLD